MSPATLSSTSITAMGTRARIAVDGPRHLLATAVARIAELEHRWSRFRPTSELSRLNRAGGRPTLVSDDTLRLLEACLTGWTATDGRFDPSVLDALCAHGYDRDLVACRRRRAPRQPEGRPAPGLTGLVVDRAAATVQLPPAVRLDPGGVGKGLAADLVASELLAAGAAGAVVEIGGDVALRGLAPAGGWALEVEGPSDGLGVARVHVVEGGVATSSAARRRWPCGDGEAHHVIDPATGRPATTAWASVTVVAGTAWWAEVMATSILLGGPADDVAALAVGHDGAVHRLGLPGGWA